MTENTFRLEIIVVLVLCLTTLTWFVGEPALKYQAVDAEFNLDAFPGDTTSWMISGSTENVTIENHSILLQRKQPQSVTVRQMHTVVIDEAAQQRQLRISGTLDKPVNSEPVSGALIPAVFYLRFNTPKGVWTTSLAKSFTGMVSAESFDVIVPVPPDASRLWLVWSLRGSTSARLRNIQLSAVERSGTASYLLLAVWLLWLVPVIGLLLIVADNSSITYASTLAICLALMLLGVGVASSVIFELLEPLNTLLQTVLPVAWVPTVIEIADVGHYFMFGVLTLLLLSLRQRLSARFVTLLLLCGSIALATEALQRHQLERSPEWIDVLIDVAGIATAVLLYYLWSRFLTRFLVQSKSL